MNVTRYLQEWSPWTVGLVVLALLLTGFALWTRHRERRGTWGPGITPRDLTEGRGYAPADPRTGGATGVDDADAEDRWLRGLAAVHVERAGLLHERWSLVPAFCDTTWRRHLARVATDWGTVRARAWKAKSGRLERQIAALGAEPWAVRSALPILVTQFAMVMRLGVAARHTSAPRARRRIAAVADPLREHWSGWLDFADAYVEGLEATGARDGMAARADIRILFAEGGPWHEVAWPARP